MHEFNNLLKESHAIASINLITRIYQHYFGDHMTMSFNDSDIEAQKQGVDRTVITQEGVTWTVEEKIRPPRKDGRIYQDILLEYLSSREHGTPGWVCKPLMADWLLYINMPHQHAFLMPVFLLQAAWQRNRQQWMSADRKKEAVNVRYTTVNAAVSVNELFLAIHEAAVRYGKGELFKEIAGTFIYPFEMEPQDKLAYMAIKRQCLVTL